jgi:hypothetical protein
VTWIKRGLLFPPPHGLAWAATHAALPVPLRRDGRLRVYCSVRDAEGRAHVAWFETDADEPRDVLAVSPRPALAPGRLGAFDDSGVTTSCLVESGGRLWLYYSGWTLGRTVPFHLATGLAVSDDGGETFRRVSEAPLLDRVAADPYLNASPCVRVEDGRWRMWYVSGTGWVAGKDGARHFYHLKYAESDDGVSWRREGRVAVDYAAPGEHAFARPCVVRDGDRYRMWYSFRGASYRIGYAESPDGLSWTRRDHEAGIDVSASGWDAEMLAYPWVFDAGGRRFMLYNGNDYGRTGIGLAELSPGPSDTGGPPAGGSTRRGS